MAAVIKSLVPSNSSDALFRTWGESISDQLLAGGWVQTGDSGQINWATVLAPVATSTASGYEIWNSNDNLPGISNIIFKIEYGTGTASNCPGVWVTVGFASDGAGNITGIKTGRKQVGNSNAVLTSHESPLAAGPGWFCFYPFAGNYPAASWWIISLERPVADSGGFENAVVFNWNQSTSFTSQVVTPTYMFPEQALVTAGVDNPYQVRGDAVGYSLTFAQMGRLTNPLLNFYGTRNSGGNPFGLPFSQVAIPSYGVEHVYMTTQLFVKFNGTNNAQSVLVRFE